MGESTARIGIYADDKASPVVKSVQGTMQGLAAEAKKSILTGFGLGAGVTAFSLLGRAVSGATDFVGDAIRSASNLAESQGKVNVVFGKSAGEITAWASTASQAFGQSKQQALEAVGTYGNLFQAFGVGREESAKMSKSLVELAADLASFNNTSVDDALVALRSGLSGETEPLKRYGIALSDARMRQELLAEGMTGLGATLTPLQKSTAAYALIMHDSALAQGDFARTSGGLANAQRSLDAEIADLTAQIGDEFKPILLEVVKVARDQLVPALKNAIPVMKDVGGVVLQLGQVALPLLVMWMGTKLVGALKAAGAAANSTAGALGLIVAGGIAIGNESKTFIQQQMQQTLAMRQGADAAKVFGDALIETGGDTGKAMDAVNTYLRRGLDEGTASMAAGMKQIRGVMETHRGEVVVSATRSLHDPIFDAINQASLDAQAEAAKIPKETGDAMLSRQQDLADAATTLIEFMAKALSPAQVRAKALGFLSSQAYKDGMASGTPAVVAKTIELRDLALAQLAGTSPAYTGGANLGKAWMDGIIAGIKARQSTLSISVSKMKAILYGNSPPKEGPLKDIDKGGFNIGRSWLDAFNKGLSGGVRVPSLPGMSGGGGAMVAATAGVSGGREVHIHIDQGAYIDGPSIDLLANKIAQRLRYAPGS